MDRNHAIPSFMDKARDEIAFPFLRLPVELQAEIINNISLYSDLKALCLVSKELSNVATPRLYYKVDLRIRDDRRAIRWPNDKQKDCKLSLKIHSLLLASANLLFVRVFKTGYFGPESTLLIDRLLPLLRKHFLVKFSYSTESISSFPTPLQLQCLWGRQKHLQDLKLYSHMVPWLIEFLEKSDPSQRAFLKSFTKLDICGNKMGRQAIPSTWPLRNLDLCFLQSLTIRGNGSYNPFPTLIELFASQSLVNLTKLCLECFLMEKTLPLTNLPLLKTLIIDGFVLTGEVSSPLVAFPGNVQLRSLTLSTHFGLEISTSLLTQIKGLEYLMIKASPPVHGVNQAIRDFTSAVRSHKDTLRVFKLNMDLMHTEHKIKDQQWDISFLKEIKLCSKLVTLSLPVVSNHSATYFCKLITALPSLSNLIVFTRVDSFSDWSPARVLKIFPACNTRLKSVSFKGSDKRANNDEWYQRHFVRKEVEDLCSLSKLRELNAEEFEELKAVKEDYYFE